MCYTITHARIVISCSFPVHLRSSISCSLHNWRLWWTMEKSGPSGSTASDSFDFDAVGRSRLGETCAFLSLCLHVFCLMEGNISLGTWSLWRLDDKGTIVPRFGMFLKTPCFSTVLARNMDARVLLSTECRYTRTIPWGKPLTTCDIEAPLLPSVLLDVPDGCLVTAIFLDITTSLAQVQVDAQLEALRQQKAISRRENSNTTLDSVLLHLFVTAQWARSARLTVYGCICSWEVTHNYGRARQIYHFGAYADTSSFSTMLHRCQQAIHVCCMVSRICLFGA